MSIKLSTAALPFTLVAALLVSSISLAADTAEHDHDHGDAPFALQLNNGEKWAIDAPLGEAMGDISATMRASLDTIHNDQLSAEGYLPLAAKVNDSVAHMINNCDLPEDADAQLHMIIAQLMAGSEKMAGNANDAPRAGAVQVVQAQDAYHRYFDDPGLVPVAH